MSTCISQDYYKKELNRLNNEIRKATDETTKSRLLSKVSALKTVYNTYLLYGKEMDKLS